MCCIALFWGLCSCSNKSKKDITFSKEFNDAYSNAIESEVKESKLYGDFYIGMTEFQVDSVVKEYLKKGKLAYNDILNEYASVHEDYEYTIHSSMLRQFINNKEVFLSMSATYTDSILTGMSYEIKKDDFDEDDCNLYIEFAKEFERSERGKRFLKEVCIEPETSKPLYFFIKDNLIISFQPQTNRPGSIYYDNVPSQQTVTNDKLEF